MCLLWHTGKIVNHLLGIHVRQPLTTKAQRKINLHLRPKLQHNSDKKALTYLLCSSGHQTPPFLQLSASKEHYFPGVQKSGL